MNPALISELIRWMALVPGAINVVSETVAAVQSLLLKRDGAPTDEEIKALVDRIVAQHDALPVPE
jgi:hypothetical protein